jgi:excinuclease ABC subunit A
VVQCQGGRREDRGRRAGITLAGENVENDVGGMNAMGEDAVATLGGHILSGLEAIKRLVVVDQKPIGRTPRSNLATYTGLFDHVRQLFAATKHAKARRFDAGRFSFNVAKGRCAHCEGEGFVCVELLFLPSVYAPCPTCNGTRYNDQTLEIKIRDKSIADLLRMTVDEAFDFFADDNTLHRVLGVIREVGLGYIRLGQSTTELSGGEAQRIKLATELQRAQRGSTRTNKALQRCPGQSPDLLGSAPACVCPLHPARRGAAWPAVS